MDTFNQPTGKDNKVGPNSRLAEDVVFPLDIVQPTPNAEESLVCCQVMFCF